MSIEYPWRVCNLEIKNDDDLIQCDLYYKWNYIHCVNISKKKYEKLNYPFPWYCSFSKNEMPFSKMLNNYLKRFFHTEKPILHTNSSIKTMHKNTRQMIKRFCRINYILTYLHFFHSLMI